ncbi:NUDIX hydrolase domain [Trinorchestia longiramus]|nr:NUDIX hydrolase domain [Trinorchestia longiramus]
MKLLRGRPLLCLQKLSLRHKHTLSYVDWARKFEALKNDDLECSACIPNGKFLMFSGQRPLLEPFSDSEEHLAADSLTLRASLLTTTPIQGQQQVPAQQIAWLSYAEVRELCSQIFVASALLHMTTSGQPLYAMQAGKLTDEHKLSLENMRPEAAIRDIRYGLLTVSRAQSELISRASSLLRFHDSSLYCGTCGSKTKRNAAGSHRYCEQCNENIYPNSRPVGIVLVTDQTNTKVLLVRQPRHPPGLFTCIAGFADVGETLEACVKREVAEEVGVEVTGVSYLASQNWPFPGSLMVGCTATALSDQVLVDRTELQAARWCSRTEVEEAIKASEENPVPWLGSVEASLMLPPPMTIAHCLIRNWLNTTV